MTTCYTTTDAVGNKVQKGDVVVSAYRGGSSAVMLAVVSEVSRTGGLELVSFERHVNSYGKGLMGRRARRFQVIKIDNPTEEQLATANRLLEDLFRLND